MAYWVDVDGSLKEADEETAQRYGLRPATDDDLSAHNERLADEAADTKGTFGLIGEGAQRALGQVQDIARATGFTPPMPGSEAFGPGGGMPMPAYGTAPPTMPAPPPGAETFPEASGDDARRRTRMHPVLEGIGTGAVAAPISGLAAAAAGALGGPALLGASVAGMGAEALVEAAAQEYDDAWLEERPMKLSNVAAYTAMFGVGDVLLRGGGKLAKEAIGDIGSALGLFGRESQGSTGRNLVAEAQGSVARTEGRATQSVGAASAKEMNEPFDDALATMSDRDATVLARDAEDFEPLIAMHSADDITRLNKGLSESLGNQLKKRDVQIASDALVPKQIQAQTEFATEIMGTALAAAQHLRTGGPSRIDFGNAGKRIAGTIETYARQLQETAAPADRFNLLNAMKQQVDKHIMAVGRDFGSDNTAREMILDILEPIMGKNHGKGRVTKGALREGLENPAYFGGAAKLQKALNSPWHDLLTHWSSFQKALLEETGSSEWGMLGAGRVGRESTDERVMAMITKNPRMLRQMGEHVGGVYDAYQRLIEARQAHGYVEKEGLDALSDTVRNLMEDWNLAHTVGIAKQKAKNKLRDPRKWAGKALDLAENLPGVGTPLKAARGVGSMFGDLHIAKDTPLAGVWDNALKRYARHPALGDASIYANYSPWMQDALRARGAPIPAPPKGGMGGAARVAAGAAPDAAAVTPGAAAAGEGFGWGKAAEKHGGKVAGAGLLGASAAEGDDHPEGAAGASVAGLALLLGKGGRRLLKEEAAPLIGILARQDGPDDWTYKRVRNWLKGKEPLTVRSLEHELAPAVKDANGFWNKPEFGTHQIPELRSFVADGMARTGATEDEVVRTLVSEGTGFKPRDASKPRAPRKPKGPTPPAPAVADGSGIEGEFDDMGDQLLTPPDMKDALKDARRAVGKEGQAAFKAYQSQAGFKMNEAMRTGDFSSWGAQGAGDVESYLQSAIDSGATAPGFVVRGVELSKEEVQRLTAAKLLTAKAFVSTSPNPAIAKRFAGAAKRGDQGFRKTIGDTPVLFEIEQATGVPLSAAEVTLRPGTQFKVLGHRLEKAKDRLVHVFRVRESGYAPGAKTEGLIAGGLIGLGGIAAASNASAATRPPDAPDAPDAPPSGQTGPVGMYREAIRSVSEGGDALIRDKASSMLRSRAPKGRGALRAFTGRRSLDDAVDNAREALAALQNDPGALVDRLAGSVGDLGRTHPSVYMAMVAKASSLVSYLSAEAPPRTGQTLLDPEGSPPSHDRSLDFAFKTVGALMPVQAMSDVARLDAPPEEVAAFQQNWPELWDPLKAELLGQVMRRTEAGRPVDSEKLRQLDALLGMDGQLDPSGSSAVAQQMLTAQETASAPAEPSGGAAPKGSPNGAASSFRTRLDTAQLENQIA